MAGEIMVAVLVYIAGFWPAVYWTGYFDRLSESDDRNSWAPVVLWPVFWPLFGIACGIVALVLAVQGLIRNTYRKGWKLGDGR